MHPESRYSKPDRAGFLLGSDGGSAFEGGGAGGGQAKTTRFGI